jgi:aspartyl aminopeptidase
MHRSIIIHNNPHHIIMTTTPTSRRLIRNSTRTLLLVVLTVCLTVDSSLALAASPLPPLHTKTANHIPLAQKAIAYFDASPDPYHAVAASIEILGSEFVELKDDDEPYSTKIVPGGKYYFTRNKSTLVAFAVGAKYQAGKGGFKIIGGHTDSPNLKVKPRSKRTASGCIQLGVECYGGGLWHTWFDRDLGISGRVLVKNKENSNKIEQKLVRLDRAILRVSNLAIHLQSADDRKAFEVNKEDHLSPILAMEAQKVLSMPGAAAEDDDDDDDKKKKKDKKKDNDGWTEYQEPLLLQLVADELDVAAKDIVDFELNLYDVQKASLGGAYSEFIHSGRLDNLASCFLAVQALAEHDVEEDEDISLCALFDHEEVGSSSAVGAGSPIMGEAVERISNALLGSNDSSSSLPDLYQSTIAKSFCLSVDQAHAVHPNYASKHEKNHQPKMNDGMVIKRNSNQRYATNAMTGFLMREVARRAGLPPIQEFVVRNDCACGSTIGPIISANTGIRAIDMGCPQLSMHSIRETMGVCDCTYYFAFVCSPLCATVPSLFLLFRCLSHSLYFALTPCMYLLCFALLASTQ